MQIMYNEDYFVCHVYNNFEGLSFRSGVLYLATEADFNPQTIPI